MRYYIFAGSLRHASVCATQNNLDIRDPNVYYVSSHHQIQNILSGPEAEFIFYETFYQHPNFIEIKEVIESITCESDSIIPVLREEPQMNEKNGLFTKTFWKRTAERVVSTFAQALIAAFGIGTPIIGQLNWTYILGIAGGAALLALIKNVAGSQINGSTAEPSWIPTTEEDLNADKESTKS